MSYLDSVCTLKHKRAYANCKSSLGFENTSGCFWFIVSIIYAKKQYLCSLLYKNGSYN